MRQVESIRANDIAVPQGRREVHQDTVDSLKDSIGRVGLRTPITIRLVDGWEDGGEVFDGQPVLVTGHHRLQAALALGWEYVECFIFDSDDEIDAEMWEISENLHRAELTKAERAEQVARWIELVEERQERERRGAEEQSNGSDEFSAKLAEKSQGRPEGGINAASRELGMSEGQARRAVKIASMSDEAKEAAKDAGLDDNQSALERIAKADDQVAEVGEITAERERREHERAQAKADEEEAQRQAAKRELEALEAAWKKARPSVRAKFLESIGMEHRDAA